MATSWEALGADPSGSPGGEAWSDDLEHAVGAPDTQGGEFFQTLRAQNIPRGATQKLSPAVPRRRFRRFHLLGDGAGLCLVETKERLVTPSLLPGERRPRQLARRHRVAQRHFLQALGV